MIIVIVLQMGLGDVLCAEVSRIGPTIDLRGKHD